jgi:hypothetical protein
MIEAQVKSREVIVMDKGRNFITSQIPVKRTMKLTQNGSVIHTAYMDGSGTLVLAKEDRDGYGNIVSLQFVNEVTGNELRWENREQYKYS